MFPCNPETPSSVAVEDGWRVDPDQLTLLRLTANLRACVGSTPDDHLVHLGRHERVVARKTDVHVRAGGRAEGDMVGARLEAGLHEVESVTCGNDVSIS